MTSHPIPADALDDRLGYFGTAGSGKTYNAGSGVERLLHAGKRCIITDPLGVWWGLRLSADGKVQSGFDVIIFGGQHGDLPLNENLGTLIGETVAGIKESCILDLSDLGTKAAERRFMLAFLSALYKHATGEPMHVIFDEADMWAPQQIRDREQEPAKLLGMMETIVRRGRVKGFVPWLISQRPAVLNKDVMSQVDGLVAFKLTSSQDRDALGDWVKGQADIGQWNEIWKSLPTLNRGEGIVWLPARGTLKTAHFPQKVTFDSSRTPKRGEKTKRETKLKALNLDSLRKRMATVQSDALANDPRIIEEADKAGYARGYRDCAAATKVALATKVEAVLTSVQALQNTVLPIEYRQPRLAVADVKPIPVSRLAAPAVKPRSNGRLPSYTIKELVTLPKANRRILIALAQYPSGRTKNQVAILTGYAVNGGGFNNAISSLRTAGHLTIAGDNLEITDTGLEVLGSFEPLPTGDALLAYWLGQLGKAEREILRVVAAAWPNPLSKEGVAAQAGYAPDGGGFNNAISRLRTFELVNGRGELKASDDLFG